jgi:NAD(P)-dependent dehydrogenase (short-subunit alcohol dehydrogenase family)
MKSSRSLENTLAKPRLLGDRIALVTGASRGIGAALCIALAEHGAHVIAVARSMDGLANLHAAVSARNGVLTPVQLDLANTDAIAQLATTIEERHHQLDILVGNAGVPGPNVAVEHSTPADWAEVLAINLTANWQLIRCMHPLLKRSDAGRAVFVSSSAVRQARAHRGLYAASKAGLESLVRSYAAANAGTPLRINLFNPGPIRTQMRATVAPGEDPLSLDTPQQCAGKLVELCLPGFQDSGRLYDYPARGYMEFSSPSVPA